MQSRQRPKVSTTPLWPWGFRQCLLFSWTTIKGKHCRHPIAIMGVVDTFGLCLVISRCILKSTFHQNIKFPLHRQSDEDRQYLLLYGNLFMVCANHWCLHIFVFHTYSFITLQLHKCTKVIQNKLRSKWKSSFFFCSVLLLFFFFPPP